jgi:two-component system, OmpR family, copper resistance phosphate regulon response regulator CusR
MKLLLVEDDRDLGAFVEEGLVREGFAVDRAQNGQQALDLASETPYDVILLDVMMPGPDGYVVLKKLRARGFRGAILLVTCKGQERDKLQGLNNGADDYVVKPFLLTEVIARVRAVLRRTTHSQTSPQGTTLKVGDLQMDLLKREVKRGHRSVLLTKKEFDILEYLMRRPGQVISQNILNQSLSNTDFPTSTNTVEVHVKNLRAKLDGKSLRSCIRTVRGCGYALES